MTQFKQLIGKGRAIFASALCLLACVLLLAPSAWAAMATNVKYIDADGQEQTCPEATVVENGSSRVTWSAGWYVVTNEVTLSKGADCSGAVHLILADTGALTISDVAKNIAGIAVTNDNSFAIYGQAIGTGALIVTGGYAGAGIGGGYSCAGSNITINGGRVTATGGTSGGSSGAGIGGGDHGAGSNITINGGTVTATGGSKAGGAGIGGGNQAAGSNITINGGTVIAQGTGAGTGIGGGNMGAGSNITINGGTVTASPGGGAAGIGGGYSCAGSNITINGGTVTAKGKGGGAGIGGGAAGGAGSKITINGGTVIATAAGAGAGIGNGNNCSTTASKIYAAEDVFVRAGDAANPTAEIKHTSAQDIASDLNGKQYVTTLTITCLRKVVKTSPDPTKPEEVQSPYVLTNGFTYTAVPATKGGGAFYVNSGATLTGTNVTFASNTTSDEGGAIYNKGKIVFDGECGFSDNVSASDGGAISSGGEVTFAGGATFERNSGLYGGAISNSGVLTFDSSATFTDNKAAGSGNVGGAIENFGGTITFNDAATFTGNSADNGGAIYNEIHGESGATGVINFAGLMDLQTAGDTWFNAANATVNWDLTGGLEQYGCISHFERYANADATVKQLISVTGDQPAGDYVIATGDMTEIFGKDTFSITNVTSGGAARTVIIDADAVLSEDKLTGYKLVTEPAGETTNLVLKVTQYTCERTELNSGDSTNLVEGTTYTAAPVTANGGAFILNSGAALTGTNVTFEGNAAVQGGSIYNNGKVVLTNAVFTGNTASMLGGAIYNMVGTIVLTNVVFTGNTVAQHGGSIYNNKGTLSLDGVTFEGNEATMRGGAIYNSDATVHFDGAVTLVTTNDTIRNYKGTLNWNLADGKNGVLNGYDKLSNSSGTLQLTVEDYQVATNFVIATGDFTDVKNKDTFVITNVSSAASVMTTINGPIAKLGETYLKLVTEEAGETTNLVLRTVKVVCELNDGMRTTYHATVAEALKAASGSSNNIKLLSDTDTAGIVTSATFTLDLNGHSLTNVGCSIVGQYAIVTIKNTGTTGGLVNKGTINFSSTLGVLNLSDLAWGEGGLIPGNEGALAIASGVTVKLNAANNSPNWMVANNSDFLGQSAAGAILMIGSTKYTLQANGIWTTQDAVAAATVVGQASAECGGTNIVYNELFTGSGSTGLQKAVDAVIADGTVTLVKNVDLNGGYINVEDRAAFTLDLNGKLITSDYDGNMLQVRSPLTILDSSVDQKGTIDNEGTTEPVVYVTTNLWFESGSIRGNDAASALVALESATVEISGGTVKNGLSAFGAATISITGGMFVNQKPADQYVAEGYVAYQTGDAEWTVEKGAKLSNVEVVDKSTKPWTTNATVVVKVGGYPVEPNADGTYTVPQGKELMVVYTAAEGQMIGLGGTTKTVALGPLTDDYAMTDGDKPTTDVRWAKSRKVKVDLRERIIVAAPEEVLPIAYSTNAWGSVRGTWQAKVTYGLDTAEDNVLVPVTNVDGYAEWMPEEGIFGKYMFKLAAEQLDGPKQTLTRDGTIYYSTYFPLTLAASTDGTYVATTNGVEATGSFDLLGYSFVNLTATPDQHYQFTGWTATTNGIAYADGFTDPAALVTRFEMPNSEATVNASFAWQSEFMETVTVKAGETWEVFEDDSYLPQGLENNGTVAWKPGTTNKLGKVSGLADFSVLKDLGAPGKLQIVVDASLTNGTHWIASNANMAGGTVFEITNGTDAENCTVVLGENLETAPWTYVGTKRFKLYVNDDDDLLLLVKPAILRGIAVAADPVAAGTAAATTNGVNAQAVYSDTVVTVTATTTNLCWQFNEWTGVDAAGNVLSFAAPADAETTFVMVDTNVTVTANFIISEAYKFQTATAISNAANDAITAINAKNLSPEEKDGYNAQIRRDRDAQVAAIGQAVVPADVAKALTDANAAFEGTKAAAQAYADQVWTIASAVAYTNIAGTVSVTNESQARLAVTVVATTNLYWQFANWTGIDAAGNDLAFADETSAETTFAMPETNVTVTANFIVSEAYKAALTAATDDEKAKADQALEAMRNNRLTDEECDAALLKVQQDYDSATNKIATAVVPTDALEAADKAKADFEETTEKAAEESAAKPFEFVIASDFSANPPFEPLETNAFGEVTVFAWNDQVWTNGVNAFTSFTKMQENETLGAFATNLHVLGAQTIADDLAMADTWNLDLVAYQDEAGNDILPIVTVGKKADGTLVDITDTLGLITGEGEIVLGKTDVNPSIYDDHIDDPTKISVTNAGSEQKKDPQSETISVDVDDRAKAEKTESGETAIVVAGVENTRGDISVTVEKAATNDVVVAGNVDATIDNDVAIVNASTNELLIAGTVIGKNVIVRNIGKEGDVEGVIIAKKIEASGNVMIDNVAHFEANVSAIGRLVIGNKSHRTLVGTYAGGTVELTSDDGTISNVTFVSDGPVTLRGTNVLTGSFAIEAPAGAITNLGKIAWDVRGGNTTATLADFDAITLTSDQLQVEVDAAPENNEFVLARNAAGADGLSVSITGYAQAPTQTAVVNGETLYPGAKAFTLFVNANDELVLKIHPGIFAIASHTENLGDEAQGDGGSISVPSEAIVGTTVNVLATPAAYWQFNGWKGTYAYFGVTNDLSFAAASAKATSFEMPIGTVDITATFALDETYRAEQAAAVSNDAAQAIADIYAIKTLTPEEIAPRVAAVEQARDAAVATIAEAIRPEAVQTAAAVAEEAYDAVREDGEQAAEAMVRFEQTRFETEAETMFSFLVYGGSTNRSTAVTLNFIKGTYTAKPTAYVGEERVKFPIVLNWTKGDREPKVITLKIGRCHSCCSDGCFDKFFTLQLAGEVVTTVGSNSIATVTVIGNRGRDEKPYVRALAWPATGGTVTGSRKLTASQNVATLQARAAKPATFAGWYKAKPGDPEQIDLEEGFVTSARKLVVSREEAGTYYAYFTGVPSVIAVDDPDFSDAMGIATNANGVATCTVGQHVLFPMTYTVDEGDTSGRLFVSRLPSGLKFDRTTGLVSGVPSRTGTFKVKAMARNQTGSHILEFVIEVLPLPEALIGTFKGFLCDEDGEIVGDVRVVVSSVGSFRTRVRYGRRSYVFSTKGFVEGDGYDIYIEKPRTGELTVSYGRNAAGEPDGTYSGEISGVKFGEGRLTFIAE